MSLLATKRPLAQLHYLLFFNFGKLGLGFERGRGFCRDANSPGYSHDTGSLLDIRKIEAYCLNPSHPLGRHKARLLGEALGLQRSDAGWLRDVLLAGAARIGETPPAATEAWGSHWVLDTTVERHGKIAEIIMIWIVRTGENTPIFVTCWVP